MPELPEVETVKRILLNNIVGKTIIDIDVRYAKIIQNMDVDTFKSTLIGQTFTDIQRRGKHLICVLTTHYLIVHLRMEGKFFLMHDEELNKHDHIIFKFSESELRYNDTRKFGTMFVYPNNLDIMKIKPLSNVGYEPFQKEMTVSYLMEKFKKSNKPIKTILLDQTIIAGLGNIYVDEVLFMCQLYPETKASLLNEDDAKNIIDNSIIVLNKAINLGGTTIRSFQSSHDITGRFQNELLVHTKKTCPTCSLTITKIFVGGRGTYFCEHCQKKQLLDN